MVVMRVKRQTSVEFSKDLTARLVAATKVLDVPKSRILRRALTAYLDGLPAEQREAIDAKMATAEATP